MKRDRKPPADFHHSPFKSLKGLPVSGGGKPAPVAPAKPGPAAADGDDHDLFAREMAWRDVRPLDGRTDGRSGKPTPAAPVESAAAAESCEFLAAVGALDKTFRDELPVADETPRARPRRMKQLERGDLKVAAELDLHGLTRDEAVARAEAFLAHAARQGWEAVVIVTGKGLHSSEGPVLRRAVEQLLARSRATVLEWGEAPRRLGGAGALAVFLRRQK